MKKTSLLSLTALAAAGFMFAATAPVEASGTKCQYYGSKAKLKDFGTKYHTFCTKKGAKNFKEACKEAGRKARTNSSGKVRCLAKG